MFSAAKTRKASTGGYSVTKSLRFRSSASAYLNRTPASASNRIKWTLSFWAKLGLLDTANHAFFSARIDDNNRTTVLLQNNQIILQNLAASASGTTATTAAVYRDASAWYHVNVIYDSANATAANRFMVYVNGILQATTGAYPALNDNSGANSTGSHAIGRIEYSSPQGYFDGYLAEVNFIDGQALIPSSFGTYDTNGVWQPVKYSGTYGTNGFYLPFTNTTSTATLGNDFSGNSNTWTVNNISLTAGSTYDSMTDSPTVSSASVANYAVLNPLDIGSLAPSSGNLWMVQPAQTHTGVRGTFRMPTTGKWYFEAINLKDQTPGTISSFIGLATSAASMATYAYNTTGTYGIYGANTGNGIVVNGTLGSAITPFPANAVLQLAYDSATGNLWLGVNNVWYNSTAGTTGNPSAGTNPTMTVSASLGLAPYLELFNNSLYANFGQQPFTYTPPTGFNALNTYNLPTPTIANGAQYMAATTYTGTGATQTISDGANNTIGTTFQPDLVWIKSRSAATDHALYDVVRGTTLDLASNTTAAETTQATGLTAFGSTGFTIGALAKINTNAATYVGWQWKANGTGVSNTAGSITSTVSANTTAGFSVVTYTGTGANATVGHSLGVSPSMVFFKQRSTGTFNWQVYHSAQAAAPANGSMSLNLTNAYTVDSTVFNNTAPTSSVFSVGTANAINQSTQTYVAYCWAAISGFSAFGSYTGNGSVDGPFVYTGFRPRWIMVKASSTTSDWYLWDTSRDTFDVMSATLLADISAVETSVASIDGLSNGFKCRSATVVNASGTTYVYAAFAENPFQSSRAR